MSVLTLCCEVQLKVSNIMNSIRTEQQHKTKLEEATEHRGYTKLEPQSKCGQTVYDKGNRVHHSVGTNSTSRYTFHSTCVTLLPFNTV